MIANYQPSFRELRYATKKHWATRTHYDLRLEWNGVLLSWALPWGPSCRVGDVRTAIEMEDHKRANLLFEGIHKTGPIMAWDRGTWEPHADLHDISVSLDLGFLAFVVRGEKLQGIWTLARQQKATRSRRAVWTMRKEAELFGSVPPQGCLLEERPDSVTTGRTVEQIVSDWNGGEPPLPSLFQQ